ncbi:amidohydrolase [Peribacillus sp. NPDC094092]|uniref:amidohydrolase n=1 Tax=Peribacillus sp. NPDC094092 TaxID=3390611 RepID=UPI003CFE24FB
MSSTFWLTNALLESGYQLDNGVITGTKTECSHLLIKDGKIAEIVSSIETFTDNLPKKDAKRLLVLPSFIEKHCHLDKTYLGEPWRAVIPADTVVDCSEMEKRILHSLPTTTKERAETMLGILVGNGSTHVRTHVDLYPEIGLRNLEAVKQALDRFSGKLTHEIVAFPQHGLLRSQSKSLIREALRQGADLVGGVDPATVDGDIEASLVEMMDLAVEANVGVDLHLHDEDYLGIFTMNRLAALTVEAGWQGRVAISHAFALGEIPDEEAREVASMLAEAGITIVTALQHSETMPPIQILQENGVTVAVGCDNIFDSWRPFGNGDVLERACRLTERFNLRNEYSLSQALGTITGGKTPLDKAGKRVWPQPGDEANMILVDASCSAEAVARRTKRKAVIFRGNIVAGGLEND